MRISDWSSDVCSSDLGGAPLRRRPYGAADPRGGRECPDRTPHPPRRRKRRPGIAEWVLSSLQRGGLTFAALASFQPCLTKLRWTFQLGRASCRERVCQSWWVSVVPLPLKTIKSTHT